MLFSQVTDVAGPPTRQRFKTVGEFIRDYIDEYGPAYVAELWEAYCNFCDSLDYNQPTYSSFRSTVYVLRDEGLIALHHTEDTSGGVVDRHYYDIAGSRNDSRWRNVWKTT